MFAGPDSAAWLRQFESSAADYREALHVCKYLITIYITIQTQLNMHFKC